MRASARHELHQQLSRAAGWSGHAGELPIVPGTVIRLQVGHLPGNRIPSDLWLWHHAPPGTPFDLDLLWKTYLRRFEHTFRLIKGTLGWTTPQTPPGHPAPATPSARRTPPRPGRNAEAGKKPADDSTATVK